MDAEKKGVQAPKSTAERQADYRARKAAEKKTEVRGIFAKPEHHEKIKKYAARFKRDV